MYRVERRSEEPYHELADASERDDGADGADDAMKEQHPLATYLEKAYSIKLAEPDRELIYRSVTVSVRADNDSSVLFTNQVLELHEKKAVMLAAVVLEEYALCATDHPVSVQLRSSETELVGTASTPTKRTWSAVLIPGTQFNIKEKVMFEPPATDIAVAREMFPQISAERCKSAIIEVKNGTFTECWLCVESLDGKPAGAICPLGYVLIKSGAGYSTREGFYHGGSRQYIVLPKKDTNEALVRFQRDSMDARPIVSLNQLYVDVKSDESANKFALSMKMGFFYYET